MNKNIFAWRQNWFSITWKFSRKHKFLQEKFVLDEQQKFKNLSMKWTQLNKFSHRIYFFLHTKESQILLPNWCNFSFFTKSCHSFVSHIIYYHIKHFSYGKKSKKRFCWFFFVCFREVETVPKKFWQKR